MVDVAPLPFPAPGNNSETTVAHVIGAYLADKEAQHGAALITKGSLSKARYYCLAFVRDFGSLPVSSCRKTDLKRFLALHPEYKSPSTKHDAAGAVVTCFRWAEDEGLAVPCPYRRPRDLPAQQPRAAIRPEEVRAVLRCAKTNCRGKSGLRFRMAFWFLAETGIRTNELYNLDWQHYDQTRGVFELPSKATRKTGQSRLIVLGRRAWRLIEWMRRHRCTGPVFLNGRNRAWKKSAFDSLFRRYGDLAGVRKEITAYCCRHSWCCRALESGAGERQIADYMGQASTRYVVWYSRSIRRKVEYLRAIGEAVRKH